MTSHEVTDDDVRFLRDTLAAVSAEDWTPIGARKFLDEIHKLLPALLDDKLRADPPDYVEWKLDPPECIHHTTGPGPRYPLRHGSWATVVCVNCGKWVIKHDHEKPYKPAIKWRDASELLIEIAIGHNQ